MDTVEIILPAWVQQGIQNGPFPRFTLILKKTNKTNIPGWALLKGILQIEPSLTLYSNLRVLPHTPVANSFLLAPDLCPGSSHSFQFSA